MNAHIPMVRLIGSSLLAVIAAAALVLAVLMFFAAWATDSQLGGVAGSGTVAVLVVAALALAYAGVAAYASREEWRARPLGRMLGLAVAMVAVLAAGTTLLAGNVAESALLLYLAMGLGFATAVPMLLPDRP